MKATALHSWQVSTHEAIAIQKRLRAQVINENTGELRYIAGADIATEKDSPKAYAGVVVLSYPALDVVEERGLEDEVTFPYVPGLLACREGPALIKVFEQLSTDPDVIVFDGQGLAHPRGMCIATHMGLVFDKPSIGCAKSLLFGRYQSPTRERRLGGLARPTGPDHRGGASFKIEADLCVDWSLDSLPRFASSWRVRAGTHSEPRRRTLSPSSAVSGRRQRLMPHDEKSCDALERYTDTTATCPDLTLPKTATCVLGLFAVLLTLEGRFFRSKPDPKAQEITSRLAQPDHRRSSTGGPTTTSRAEFVRQEKKY
jgi:deoxyinosine 3'endonuclease (endonuclease V)